MNWADETENEELERERLRELEKENQPAQPSVTESQAVADQTSQSQENVDQRRSSERSDDRDNSYRGGYDKQYDDRRDNKGYDNNRRGGYNNYNNRYDNRNRQDGGGYNSNRYDNRNRQDGGGYNNRYDNRNRQDGGGYNNNRSYDNNRGSYNRFGGDRDQPKYAVILSGYDTEPTQDNIVEFISNSEKIGQVNIASIDVSPTSTTIVLKDVESYQALCDINGEIFQGKPIVAKGQSTNRFADNKPPRYNQQQQQQPQPHQTSFGQPPSDRPKSNPFGSATPVDTDKILREKEEREKTAPTPAQQETSQQQSDEQPQQQKSTEPYRPKQHHQQQQGGDLRDTKGGFRKSNDSFNNNRDVQRNDKFNNNRKDFGGKKGGFDNMKPKGKPQIDQDGWTTSTGGKMKDLSLKSTTAPTPKKDTAAQNKFASLMDEDD